MKANIKDKPKRLKRNRSISIIVVSLIVSTILIVLAILGFVVYFGAWGAARDCDGDHSSYIQSFAGKVVSAEQIIQNATITLSSVQYGNLTFCATDYLPPVSTNVDITGKFNINYRIISGDIVNVTVEATKCNTLQVVLYDKGFKYESLQNLILDLDCN